MQDGFWKLKAKILENGVNNNGGIINPLFNGLTLIRVDILLIAHIFPSTIKYMYYATPKIFACIIC